MKAAAKLPEGTTEDQSQLASIPEEDPQGGTLVASHSARAHVVGLGLAFVLGLEAQTNTSSAIARIHTGADSVADWTCS